MILKNSGIFLSKYKKNNSKVKKKGKIFVRKKVF